MGVQAEATVGTADGVDVVEEDERPEQLAQVRRAHQARHRSVLAASGAMHYAASTECLASRSGRQDIERRRRTVIRVCG